MAERHERGLRELDTVDESHGLFFEGWRPAVGLRSTSPNYRAAEYNEFDRLEKSGFSSLDVINGIDGNHGGRHSPALESSERLGYKATIRFVPLAGIKRRQRQDMKFRSDFRPGTSRRVPWLDYAILRIVCQGL